MALNPSHSAAEGSSLSPQGYTKQRIRFRKGGNLRLVSHHDLMHVFERMFRRADLPLLTTEGFNPRPKMVFALSLALGVVGAAEVLEVELDGEFSADEVKERMAQQAPDGLRILSVTPIDKRTRAQACKATYRMQVPKPFADELPARIAELLAAESCWIERTRPRPRKIDLRPFVDNVRLVDDSLEMDIVVTPNGSARPQEIAELLGLGDNLEEVVFERTWLELIDETNGKMLESPATRRASSEDLQNTQTPNTGSKMERKSETKPTSNEPGKKPTPLIAGPLSFDS